VVNGVEKPIGFMSRTLVNAERRWTAIEKECYALHMTLKKFEYLLRDVPFTLYTDHANLVYLNVPPSSKVLRWKMAMQEYNFRLFHIPGERNVVADGFSRLTEETPAATFNVLNIIEEPFISVGTELIRASEENVSLDVTASPPSETADRGNLCPLSNSPNDMTIGATGEPMEPSQMVWVNNPDLMNPALLNAYCHSIAQTVNIELESEGRPFASVLEVSGTAVSPLTAPRSVPTQALHPLFPGPTTPFVGPQTDIFELYNPNCGFLAPLEATEPSGNSLRRSTRLLRNTQSASQEVTTHGMENPSEPHLPLVRNTEESTQTQYSDVLNSANKEQNNPIVRDDEIYNWFTSIHNSWMGHRGLKQSLELLRLRGHIWPTMKADVSRFISTCPTCQKLDVRRIEIQTHPYTTSTYQPHECLNIDTLVLNQPDKHGNIAIIVVIDTFTRWLELYPIPDYTAEIAAMKLLEHFGRYGAPKTILTDRGAQFANEIVTKVCESFGTKYQKTPIAHSHEHNGKVENANRQVLRSIRAFILDERVMNDWTRALPAVQFIFNTTRHRDIGFTSAELLFGPAVNMNRFLLDARGKRRTPEEALTWWD